MMIRICPTLAAFLGCAFFPGSLLCQDQRVGEEHPPLFAIAVENAISVGPVQLSGLGTDRQAELLETHLADAVVDHGFDVVGEEKSWADPTLHLAVAGGAVGDSTVYTATLAVRDRWYNPSLRDSWDFDQYWKKSTRFGDSGASFLRTVVAAHVAASSVPVVMWKAAETRTVLTEALESDLRATASQLVADFAAAFREANP